MSSHRATPRNGRGPWWRRVRLLDVVFASAPLIGIGAWLFGSACLDYYRIRQYDDWWSRATSVRKFGWYRLRAAVNLPRAAALREGLVPDDEQRATLRLRVDQTAFEELSSDVGGHWGQWLEAAVMSGDSEVAAELRFRGDGSAHWTAEKKSLSIKTGKDVLYQGFRRLNFSLKDVLPQYLTNSLARDFELLAPETAVMPVFVNDRYYGIFRFVEDVDESFLRRSLRMPGNIYRADAAERGEYLKHLPRDVFVNPAAWERVAANDRPGAPERWGIHLLLDDLLGSTLEDHARLMARLDRDELARLLALMLISGDPYHMSGVHNQLWYDDPVDGRLHPIVWDLRLLDLAAPPRGSNWNRFWQAALRDPRVLDRALTEIATRIHDDALLSTARERVETTYGLYREHFEYDHLREGVIHTVGHPATTLSTLEGNLALLAGWLEDARVDDHVAQLDASTWLIDVRSSGRAAAVLAGLDTDGAEVELFADVDRDGRLGDGDRALALVPAAGGFSLLVGERLPSACAIEGPRLEPAPLDYRFLARAPGARSLRARYSNGQRHATLAAGALEAGQPLAESAGWHPWRLEQLERPAPRETLLSGQVHLAQDLVIGRDDRLTIAAGTALTLAPDVSILVKGRLSAEGTAEAPIVVRSGDPALPFGSFALQGPGADGSRLTHVTFLGGGGALLERVEYKGAVCVYGARDVVFEHCAFADNLRCDDLLNVVLGQVDLLACRFERANADSIDYDLSTGRIEDCQVLDSGNDGLDLMTCSPWVSGLRIVGSGDKGISIGEAATPFITGTSIEDCVIGMEIKDLSTPVVVDSRIAGCEQGVLERRKNWRYAGAGRGTFLGTLIEGNGSDLELLDGASLTLHEAPGAAALARQPLAALHFDGLFGPPQAGWKRMGGARRVSLLDGDLHASFRDFEGAIGRELGWEVPGQQHVLVVTAAGTGVRAARVGLTLDGRTVEAPLALDGDPTRFRLTVIPLPAGTLETVVLAVDPDPQGARLAVRGLALLAGEGLP